MPHLQCFEKYTDVSMVKCGGKIKRWEILDLDIIKSNGQQGAAFLD